MTTQDNHNVLTPAVALNIQAISSNTTTAGNIIDTQGYQSLEFVAFSATLTDGSYTPLIEEGNAANLSDASAVADGDLLGTEAGAAFALTNDNAVTRIGYRGQKRYVRLSIVSASVTTGGTIGAVVLKGHPTTGPVA